jgi:hypothetical protein
MVIVTLVSIRQQGNCFVHTFVKELFEEQIKFSIKRLSKIAKRKIDM